MAEALFPFGDPLKETVQLGNYYYNIVGVLASRMPLAAVGGSSQSSEEFNKDVYIPLKTCRVRYGERILIRQSGSFSGEQVELSQVTLTIKDMESVRPTGAIVTDLLERYHGNKGDYAVTIPRIAFKQPSAKKIVSRVCWP